MAQEPIHEMFLRTAERRGAHPAISSGDRQISYRELADRSAALAASLLAAGLAPGEPVAILAAHSAQIDNARYHVLDERLEPLPLLGLGSSGLDENAREYLAKLHLDRKVRVENGTLSTLDLSQGQRKRLALLTAYLEDRPIYLFDEWAADQDPQFKEIFYLQLLPELKKQGKTILVISHDDRYYGVADRIVKLSSGRIEYDGDVEEYLDSLAGPSFAATPRVACGLEH